MTDHDSGLEAALQENVRLRAERDLAQREEAADAYVRGARQAERVYWVYGIACVALGVAAFNFFARSYDTKTLIGSAVVLLVLYETTVLMKLWFAIARTKLDTLKEIKLLRLETARLAEKVGVEEAVRPTTEYQPLSGVSRVERWLWLSATVVIAAAVSGGTVSLWFQRPGGESVSLVRLDDKGGMTKTVTHTKAYTSFTRPRSYFSTYSPAAWTYRVEDRYGQALPVASTTKGDQTRHEVKLLESVFDNGQLRYTERFTAPDAVECNEGVCRYQGGGMRVGSEAHFSTTVELPAGAVLVATDPASATVVETEGTTQVRYEWSTRTQSENTFLVSYRLQTHDNAKDEADATP